MAYSIEYLLIGISLLLLASIVASKASSRLGIPSLLIFIAIGMLAGSDGIGGIYFDNAWVAQAMGVVALVFILFAGGVSTDWRSVRPVMKEGLALATLGVALTAGLVGLFAVAVLRLSLLEGLLLGAIISSTDAAAVFSVLRSRSVNLKDRLKPLLEFESGCNDPMAVFLTVAVIRLMTEPNVSPVSVLPIFAFQAVLGAVAGFGFGRATVLLVNRLRLEYEGLYPVLTLSMAVLTYALTAYAGGSGFLAVYMAGLVVGNSGIAHKRSLGRFHDGLAWLMQIAMFLTLGLLVFPSHLPEVIGAGLLASLFLMFVARPASVFLSLPLSKLDLPSKIMVSWVGLRGAVPIILATFPLVAGVPKAEILFNLVFFIVLTSALLQGTTIPLVARWLKVAAPLQNKRRFPLELEKAEGVDADLVELIVPYGSDAVGKAIVELNFPRESMISLICRNDNFVLPSGSTELEEGDVLQILVTKAGLPHVRRIIEKQREEPDS